VEVALSERLEELCKIRFREWKDDMSSQLLQYQSLRKNELNSLEREIQENKIRLEQEAERQKQEKEQREKQEKETKLREQQRIERIEQEKKRAAAERQKKLEEEALREKQSHYQQAFEKQVVEFMSKRSSPSTPSSDAFPSTVPSISLEQIILPTDNESLDAFLGPKDGQETNTKNKLNS